MVSWKVTNLIEVVMRGRLVWQAWALRRVKQAEAEEEEEDVEKDDERAVASTCF